MTQIAAGFGLLCLALASLAGALRPRLRLSSLASAVGSAALTLAALGALSRPQPLGALSLGPAPFALRWELVPLGAWILLLVGGVGALASVYGEAYVRHREMPQQRTILTFVPLFVGSMALVTAAADAISFLVAWEAMSLTSYALVLTDSHDPAVLRSGYIYLVMTHVGAVCLTAAFLLLGNATGSWEFATWARLAPGLPAGLRNGVFLLLVVAFGGKAALVPLHVWLPRAHPVAPSHVSGLMSGVMLKVAVFGLALLGVGILGPGPLWWGLAVLGLGLASAVLGVLYALMEHDLKRLLAYHSVENMGIIAMGLGVALIGRHAHLPQLALLGLVAALFHTLNHALFKTALFLDAGSVQEAGAGRNLDGLGGLLRSMPWTMGSLVVAAIAISGLPPLNGFASEWLTYQALLRLVPAGRGLALAGMAGILGLALTGGLAAACFVKVSGVGALARPRQSAAAGAHEVARAMWVPPLVLAALCVGLGLVPGVVLGPLERVAGATLGLVPGAGAASALRLSLPWETTGISPAVFGVVALLGVLGASGLLAATSRRRPRAAVGEPWACGGALGVDAQYSATAYAKPFRQVFGVLYQPVRAVETHSAVHPFFRVRVVYEGSITPVFDRYLYAPVLGALLVLARHARRVQSGSLRLYLGYVLVTLVLLLAFAH